MTHLKAISRTKVQRAENDDATAILEVIFAFVVELIEMKGKNTA